MRATKALQQGVVLAGRYRLKSTVGEANGARIYEAEDLQLADRRALVAEVVSDDRAGLAKAWLAADSPWTASLLDVVAIDGRVCGVFDIDADAASLQGAAGLSREQRASLIVDVARIIDRRLASGVAVRYVTDITLWIEGLPAEARLRAIPLPNTKGAPDDEIATDLAALARLAAQQLFGIDPTMPPANALDRLPDGIQAVLEPLYADSPAERLSAGARPDVLHAVLGLSHGASRVPVPVVQGPPLALAARLSSGNNHTRRKSLREIGGAIGFLLFLLAFFTPFGSSEASYVPSAVSVVPPLSPPSETQLVGPTLTPQVYSVPLPVVETQPGRDHLRPIGRASLFHTAIEDGPVPVGAWPVADLAALPPYLGHVRIFETDDLVYRVERFAPRQRLTSVTNYTYDNGGRVIGAQKYSSTGALLLEGVFKYEGSRSGVYEGRYHTGAAMPIGCASVEFDLDREGRYTSRRCLNRAGNPSVFSDGHHEERVEYADAVSVSSYWDAQGDEHYQNGEYQLVRTTRDGQGRVAREEFLDFDGDPVLNSEVGGASVQHSRPSSMASAERLFGIDGEPVLGAGGWHRAVEMRRSTGELSSYRTYGLSGEPVVQLGTDVAEIRYLPTDERLIGEERYFGARGQVVVDANGAHRIEYIRDSHNNILRQCHFGTSAPVVTAALDDVHCIVSSQDEYGFVMSEAFYNVDGTRMLDSRARVHSVRFVRDALNRVTHRSFWNGGLPQMTWAGYHAVSLVYDEWGDVTDTSYLATDLTPAITTTGIATVRRAHDEAGREIRRCFFGSDGSPAASRAGFSSGTHCMTWLYLDGLLEEIGYIGADGNPVNAQFTNEANDNAAFLHFRWGPGGTLESQAYYDVGRVLTRTIQCRAPQACIAVDGWSWHIP